MSIEEKDESLSLNKVVKAGWFQWYNLEKNIQYPECHVLTYKIKSDIFASEVLDFNFFSMGNTIEESFDSLSDLCLDYLNKYKETDPKLEYKSSEAEKWNKFRDIYSILKMEKFKNSSENKEENNLLFSLHKENNKLKDEREDLVKRLHMAITKNIEQEETIAILRGMIDEINGEQNRYIQTSNNKNIIVKELIGISSS